MRPMGAVSVVEAAMSQAVGPFPTGGLGNPCEVCVGPFPIGGLGDPCGVRVGSFPNGSLGGPC
ncbi:hypothetical protein DPMN_191971 [Dreissena polymorpha]|uniref:Uncharacterized protein n=1 Tax=Dreissena polymorpha TaxID=45954 RepID=A0A9D3Y0K2_DREPO|nr:hypothetical protein DPMN_191971 [Dreissena polymorpha]